MAIVEKEFVPGLLVEEGGVSSSDGLVSGNNMAMSSSAVSLVFYKDPNSLVDRAKRSLTAYLDAEIA